MPDTTYEDRWGRMIDSCERNKIDFEKVLAVLLDAGVAGRCRKCRQVTWHDENGCAKCADGSKS